MGAWLRREAAGRSKRSPAAIRQATLRAPFPTTFPFVRARQHHCGHSVGGRPFRLRPGGHFRRAHRHRENVRRWPRRARDRHELGNPRRAVRVARRRLRRRSSSAGDVRSSPRRLFSSSARSFRPSLRTCLSLSLAGSWLASALASRQSPLRFMRRNSPPPHSADGSSLLISLRSPSGFSSPISSTRRLPAPRAWRTMLGVAAVPGALLALAVLIAVEVAALVRQGWASRRRAAYARRSRRGA